MTSLAKSLASSLPHLCTNKGCSCGCTSTTKDEVHAPLPKTTKLFSPP